MSGLLKLPCVQKKNPGIEKTIFLILTSWSYSIQPDICDSYHPILHFWHVHKMSWWESRERLQNHSVCKICSVLSLIREKNETSFDLVQFRVIPTWIDKACYKEKIFWKLPPFLNLEQGTSNISLIRLHTLIHKGNQGPTILAMACLIMNIVCSIVLVLH